MTKINSGGKRITCPTSWATIPAIHDKEKLKARQGKNQSSGERRSKKQAPKFKRAITLPHLPARHLKRDHPNCAIDFLGKFNL